MAIKVVFVGNALAGDDGIGPYLYEELRGHPSLDSCELIELGTTGLDLISHVKDSDKLIIVDAVRAGKDIGGVVLLNEDEISDDISLVSLHDFGVEQTVKLLRVQYPHLPSVHFVAVKVEGVSIATDRLSPAILRKMPRIKKEVVSAILKAAG
jgi:hydrogenase maturation protease